MEDFGIALTKLLAFTTLVGNLSALGLLIFFVIRRPIYEKIMNWLGERAIPLGFLLTLASTVGSLVYSEVVGFVACILCWIQRIFMYPQMFVFGLAFYRKDGTSVAPYMLFLSLLGGAVALYHWVKNMLLHYGAISVACPAVAGLPSCDNIDVFELGYITIPMISLNAFVWISIVMWASLRRRGSKA